MSHSRNVMVKQEMRPTLICFICGSPSVEFCPLNSKPRENGPFFTFLEHHQPPSGSLRPGPDGVVGACFLCYSFLTQQWDNYERSSTSHGKRIYWLKRVDNGPFAGMDSGVQSEYATNYLGLAPQTNHVIQQDKRDAISPDTMSQSTLGSQYNKNEYAEPLDCSMEEPPRLLQAQRNDANENASSVLDLSVPTRPINNSSPSYSILACYACGEDAYRGSLINVYTKPISNCPFFPNLWSLPKPANAKAIDSSGKVEVCDLCHKHLIKQWEAYQRANVPNNERQYHIQQHYKSSKEGSPSTNQFFCFTCGQEYPKSVRREIKTQPTSEGEPFFRFLEKHQPAPGARPITSEGRAMVCTLCYKALIRQFQVYHMERTPEENRRYKIPADFPQESNVLRERLLGHSKSERSSNQGSPVSSCYLCERSSNSMKIIDTLPNQASKMYFPFIREMPKTSSVETIDNMGRITVCLSCYRLLQTQWEAFQNAQVPVNQRHYSLTYPNSSHNRPPTIDITSASPPLTSIQESSAKNHNSALHIQVTLPEETSSMGHQQDTAHEPLLTTVTTMSYTSVITTPSRHIQSQGPPSLASFKEQPEQGSRASKSSKDSAMDDVPDNQNNPRIYNPLELPTTKQPLMVATTCFICGECSAPGFTYTISVFPSRSSNSEEYQTPFFPFLSKHLKPTAADVITEDGTILGCTFCFHSLMAQWLAYETSPHAEDSNHWTRKYNCHHYVCYICGITTYRQRVRAITVRDFPFLVEHPRPPGALTTQNGESVVTCLTCFESLMSQWKDFERMKLPVEMRKYNWIVLPPPPDDINLIDPAVRQNYQQNLNRDSTPVPPGSSRTPTPSVGPSSGHYATQDGSNRHDNQSGLGHGVSKPAPMLNMQQHHPPCNSTAKPVSVRSMAAAVSPLYQVGPPQSHAPNSTQSHSLGAFGGNPAAAYNAARTSSFAAALRKLAKQAVDPATEKDLSPITPVSSPAFSQRSVTPKRSMAPGTYNHLHSHPHSHSNRLPSPPPSNGSGSLANSHHDGQKQPLDLGSMSSRDANGNRLSEPLKLDSKYDKREDHYSIKDHSNTVLQPRNHLGSSRIDDHQGPSNILPSTTSSGRGFQPYRGLDDNSRHSLAPSHSQGPPSHQAPPPTSHHLAPHFDHSAPGFPYHSAFLPPSHLTHPAYRFEDPVLLEHYSSMLRPPSLMHHPLSQSGLMPHGHVPQPSNAPPTVPFFPSSTPNSHYPRDLMMPQNQNSIGFVSSNNSNHESRHKYDDRMSSRETYSSEQEPYDRREREHGNPGMNRRLSDPANDGGNEQRNSPMQPHHVPRHLESPGGDHRIGSITHGTPRDHHLAGLVHPPTRSPESPTGGSSTPLNLAIHHHHPTNHTSQDLQRSRHLDVEMWVAKQSNNSANGAVSQNHLQDRHERYSPVPQSHPPPLLSAQPPTQHQPVPLDQHQVPIHSEYQHPPPSTNYHLPPGAHAVRETQEESNRQQYHHQQQMHLQRQQQHQMQQRKHASGPTYNNSNNDANRTNQYQKLKSKFSAAKTTENSIVNCNVSSQIHGYNGSLPPRQEDYNRSLMFAMSREKENSTADSRSTEKAVTLDRWPYYRQEGMHSRLLELEKPALESKEPPTIPSQHQSSEFSRGFHMVSRTAQAESNCIEVLVSKLDLEEARLRKSRMDGTYMSDSESSDDEMEQTDGSAKIVVKKSNSVHKEPWLDWGPRGLSRPFILVKGPPLNLDSNPEKMEIFKSVGLTTVKRKKVEELEKFLRRQQLLKQTLPIKVDETEDQENQQPFPLSILVSSLSFHQPLTVSNHHLKKLNSEQGKSKWQQKNFMASLDLRVNQDDNKEEQETIWSVILQDRCRRHRIPLPLVEIHETNGVRKEFDKSPTIQCEPRGLKRKISDTVYPNQNGLISKNTHPAQSQRNDALPPSLINSDSVSKNGEAKSHQPTITNISEPFSKKFLNPRCGIPTLQPVVPATGLSDSGPSSVPPPLIPSGRLTKPMTAASIDSEKRVAYLTTPTSKNGHGSSSSITTMSAPVKDKNTITTGGLKPPPLNTSTARQLPREFAQEFHKLVLQTTNQQKENNILRDSTSSSLPVPPPLHNPNSSFSQNHPSNCTSHLNTGASFSGTSKSGNSFLSATQLSSTTSVSSSFSEPSANPIKTDSSLQDPFYDRDNDGGLKWPGIEVIMESYEKHCREQNSEREFLTERCEYNQSHSQELNRAAEIYSQRMAELYQLKRHLDEERQRHQSSIDGLKKCLRQIR